LKTDIILDMNKIREVKISDVDVAELIESIKE